MGQSRVNKISLTITSGTDTSSILEAFNTYGSGVGLMIYSPGTLPETVEIEVSPPRDANGSFSWKQYQEGSPAADLTVPAAGKAMAYDRLCMAGAIRLKATANVGGDRTFVLSWQEIYN